jgi:hypothetical protein
MNRDELEKFALYTFDKWIKLKIENESISKENSVLKLKSEKQQELIDGWVKKKEEEKKMQSRYDRTYG